MKRKRNLFFLTEKLMNEPLISYLLGLLKSFKRFAKNQKSNIINLINLVFNNRTINKLINQINYNVDEIFKSNHLENINTEEIFNLIVKMLSSSDTLYNILKEFFLSDFFKENIHEQ